MQPHEARAGQRSQHVVDGLLRHVAEILADEADDRLRVGVRMLVHRGQHRDPRTRDAQGGPAQHALEVGGRRHGPSVPQIWNQSGSGGRRSRRTSLMARAVRSSLRSRQDTRCWDLGLECAYCGERAGWLAQATATTPPAAQMREPRALTDARRRKPGIRRDVVAFALRGPVIARHPAGQPAISLAHPTPLASASSRTRRCRRRDVVVERGVSTRYLTCVSARRCHRPRHPRAAPRTGPRPPAPTHCVVSTRRHLSVLTANKRRTCQKTSLCRYFEKRERRDSNPRPPA